MFGLSNAQIVDYSIYTIVISLIVIAISFLIIFLKNRSAEKIHAKKILVHLEYLKNSKVSKVAPAPKLEIKKEEYSLKSMLIKKFKPKIEEQLGAKVEVLDFNAKEESFLALVKITGVKILLTLDASGKIIDYKKVKFE